MTSSDSNDDSSDNKQSVKYEESKKAPPIPANKRVSEEKVDFVLSQEHPISNKVLNRWEQIRCIGKLPERRSYHTSITFKNKIYVYGGYDIKEGDMKSMFCLDLNESAPEWQEIKLTGDRPEGISRHSAILWDDKIYCLGGERNNIQIMKFFYIDISDTRMNYGQLSAKWTEIITNKSSAPLQLDSHSVIIYPESDNKDTDKMIVFGGYFKSIKSNKIFEYRFEDNVWKEIELDNDEIDRKIEEVKKNMNEYDVITDTIMEGWINVPRPRTNHTAVYYKHGMYIFGGSDESNNKLNDLWKFDFQNNRWIIINHISSECEDNQPTKRSGHTASIVGDRMYIFGGLEGITHETNDFYFYDFKSDMWNTLQLKISNPEEVHLAKPDGKSNIDPKDPSHNSHKDDHNKTQLKPQNFSLYGIDNRYSKVSSPMSKKHPSISRK